MKNEYNDLATRMITEKSFLIGKKPDFKYTIGDLLWVYLY
jgi:hypothetical protein